MTHSIFTEMIQKIVAIIDEHRNASVKIVERINSTKNNRQQIVKERTIVIERQHDKLLRS